MQWFGVNFYVLMGSTKCRGVHPLRQWLSSPCFRFPPISEKNFRLENFPNFTFSQEMFSIFIRQNFKIFLMTFFSKNCEFPPYLPDFLPWFSKIYVYLTYFVFFVSPSLCITQCTYMQTPLTKCIQCKRGRGRKMWFFCLRNMWMTPRVDARYPLHLLVVNKEQVISHLPPLS